jgi:DNA polymerase-3 subunit gamma/tau
LPRAQFGRHCRDIMAKSASRCDRDGCGLQHSVDNIREIIESARYKPLVQARYKVFIIDEVHMLSKGAFNALLKTLEEPPSM